MLHHVSFPAAVAVAGALLGFADSASLRAQSRPTVILPAASLRDIAADFDEGRNRLYCYHGTMTRTVSTVVHVDSVSIVAAASDCSGLGIGFISRTDDRSLLVDALTSLIETNAAWRVVSAFYQTEIVETYGGRFRAARALSVLRQGVPGAAGERADGALTLALSNTRR